MRRAEKTRWWTLLAVAPMVVAACSSGSGDGATNSSASDEASPNASSALSAPAGLEELLQAEPVVVDATAETRCDQFDYPCSWSDVDAADFERSHQLSIELQDLALAAADPAAGIDAALERIADVDDLAELIVDHEGLTGLMFRLEGLPEMYAMTEFAGPVGEPEELDLAELGVELEDIVGADGGEHGVEPEDNASTDDGESDRTDGTVPAISEPQGFRTLPRDYQPTGGPIVPKQALVVDPYANTAGDCSKILPAGATCWTTSKERVEGSVVHAILDAPEQITSTYAPAGADPTKAIGWDPILGPPLSQFDIVHFATHGSSGCSDVGPGWSVSWELDTEPPEPLPKHCFSMSAIGTYDKSRYAALPPAQRRMPAGLSLAGNKWAARDDYFIGKFKPTAIVYMSNCTSADGTLLTSGAYGSFVGWHGFARLGAASGAAVHFWSLMAKEGLEFDQAIEQLDNYGSTSTVAPLTTGLVGAKMAHQGKNLRARDVITLQLDGADPDGQVLRIDGMPGDGQPELFPARQQQVSFEVEGVREGTAGDVQIEFLYDGVKLDTRSPITLGNSGTAVRTVRNWETWAVTLEPSMIEIPDTTASDFAGGAKPLEVRAYTTASEYTADRGDVLLSALLASNGPIPIFTQLEAGMPANGSVEGNDLRIEFDTAGGPVVGTLRVEMFASGMELGNWQYDLDGTYDPATGRMSGNSTAKSEARVSFISGGELASGTWEATVDLAAKTVTAVFGSGATAQTYTGTITPVSTD